MRQHAFTSKACSLLLLILFVSPLILARNRAAARTAFAKARAYHEQLRREPEAKRSLRQYSRAIFLYRTVIDHDPTYGACDDAVFSIATLYDEMSRRFREERFGRKAIYYYEFVAREYPLTKHKSGALERAGVLQRRAKPATVQRESESAGSANLASISEVRYWSNDDYTRVVIQLDREVEFEREILSDPSRIYFDLKNARLAPDLEGKTYALNDLFIHQIRMAENRPGVVRVVLDFEKIEKHTVFALYDPYRIVIDTGGGRRRSAADSAEVTQKVASASAPVAPTPNLGGDRSLTRVLGLKVGRVVIDPGHGGHDTGTISRGGIREKDLVLDISLRLKKLLEERLGTEVILTRSTDRFIPLEERTAIGNQLGADLFVSIHANSSPSRKATGIETYYLSFASNADEREVASRENASSQKNIRELEDLLKQIAFGDYLEESKDLAHIVQQHLYEGLRSAQSTLRNRGVKKAPFIVLINLTMPGILTEIGFLSNPAEEKYLRTERGKDRAAESLCRGIEAYFRSLGALPTPERATGSDR